MRHLFAIFTIATAASVAALNPTVPTKPTTQTVSVHHAAEVAAFQPAMLATDPLAERVVTTPASIFTPQPTVTSDITYRVELRSAALTGERIAQGRHAFLQAERSRIAEEARLAEEARRAEEARLLAERQAVEKAARQAAQETERQAARQAEIQRSNETKRAAREAAKVRAAAPASRSGERSPVVTEGGAGGSWAALRKCESGGNYATNTGNGYYGAYQFSAQTWRALGYSGLPSSAAPAVQDEAAAKLQARSGWGQWPACSRKLGLR